VGASGAILLDVPSRSQEVLALPIFMVTIMFGALVVLSEGSVVAAFTYPEW
jgi:hypothetical protein